MKPLKDHWPHYLAIGIIMAVSGLTASGAVDSKTLATLSVLMSVGGAFLLQSPIAASASKQDVDELGKVLGSGGKPPLQLLLLGTLATLLFAGSLCAQQPTHATVTPAKTNDAVMPWRSAREKAEQQILQQLQGIKQQPAPAAPQTDPALLQIMQQLAAQSDANSKALLAAIQGMHVQQMLPVQGQPQQTLPIQGQPAQQLPVAGTVHQILDAQGNPAMLLNIPGKPLQVLPIAGGTVTPGSAKPGPSQTLPVTPPAGSGSGSGSGTTSTPPGGYSKLTRADTK